MFYPISFWNYSKNLPFQDYVKFSSLFPTKEEAIIHGKNSEEYYGDQTFVKVIEVEDNVSINVIWLMVQMAQYKD